METDTPKHLSGGIFLMNVRNMRGRILAFFLAFAMIFTTITPVSLLASDEDVPQGIEIVSFAETTTPPAISISPALSPGVTTGFTQIATGANHVTPPNMGNRPPAFATPLVHDNINTTHVRLDAEFTLSTQGQRWFSIMLQLSDANDDPIPLTLALASRFSGRVQDNDEIDHLAFGTGLRAAAVGPTGHIMNSAGDFGTELSNSGGFHFANAGAVDTGTSNNLNRGDGDINAITIYASIVGTTLTAILYINGSRVGGATNFYTFVVPAGSQIGSLHAWIRGDAADNSTLNISSWTLFDTTPATAPTVAPTITYVEGDEQVTLTWANVEHATSHELQYREVGAATWIDVTNPSSPHTVTGLTNGTAYEFQIRGVNATGDGPWGTVTATPNPPALTVAPANIVATAGNAQVELTWTAVPGATSHQLRWAASTGAMPATWTTVTSPHIVTGLTNDTAYDFEVRGTNSAGPGPEGTVTATPAAPIAIVLPNSTLPQVGIGNNVSIPGTTEIVNVANDELTHVQFAFEQWLETDGAARFTSIWFELSDGTLVATRWRQSGANPSHIDRMALGRGLIADITGTAGANTEALENTHGGLVFPGDGAMRGHFGDDRYPNSPITGAVPSAFRLPGNTAATSNLFVVEMEILNGIAEMSLTVNNDPRVMLATVNVGHRYVVAVHGWSQGNAGQSTLHIPQWRLNGESHLSQDPIVTVADETATFAETGNLEVEVNVQTYNIPAGTYTVAVTSPTLSFAATMATTIVIDANGVGTFTLVIPNNDNYVDDHDVTLTLTVGSESPYGEFELTINAFVAPPTDAPDDLTASARHAAVDLEWTAVANATHYQVAYREYPTGVRGPWSTEFVGTERAVTGLDNGQEYRFYVRATNEGGYTDGVYAYINATPVALNLGPGGPDYVFDFSSPHPPEVTIPVPGLGGAVSLFPEAIRIVSSEASQPDLDFYTEGGTFRIQNHGGQLFIDPNGGNRSLTTGVTTPLSGPIHVVIYARATEAAIPTSINLDFGGQFVTIPVPVGAAPARFEHTFDTGSGTLGIAPWSWGAANDAAGVGRLAVQRIEIFELPPPDQMIELDVDGGSLTLTPLPYGYGAAHINPHPVTITSSGNEAVDNLTVSLENGDYFVLAGDLNITNLAPTDTATFTIAPILNLPPGQVFTDTVNIVGGVINESFTVSIATGQPGISLPHQFPFVPDEVISWGHNFHRVSITAGSAQLLINREARDVDVTGAIPFVVNDVLYVPIVAAQRTLGDLVTWNVTGNTVVASANGNTFTVDDASVTGFPGVLFVPVQTIVSTLQLTNITVGWDNIHNPAAPASYTLVVSVGVTVTDAIISRGALNTQQAAWYGSPHSLTAAANLLTAQRFDGGFPRGIGQGDVNQGWGNANFVGWTPANLAGNWAAHNAIDAYFGRGITTYETRFLMNMYEHTGIERYGEAARRGLEAILGAQLRAGDTFDNGGDGWGVRNITVHSSVDGAWPYYVTHRSRHRGGASFTDEAHVHLMRLLSDINNGAFSFLSDSDLDRVADAYYRGLWAILNLQVRSNAFGFMSPTDPPRLTAWGLHHDPSTGIPMQARHFEPVYTISGDESVGVLSFLKSLDLNEMQTLGGTALRDGIIEAIHAASFWYAYVEVFNYQRAGNFLDPSPGARGLWARFYCMYTFEPFFDDRQSPTNAGDPVNNPWGLWPGPDIPTSYPYNVIGRRRNVYRCEDPNCAHSVPATIGGQQVRLSLNPNCGPLDLASTYANLSLERRQGFGYIRGWGVGVQASYNAWLAQNGLTRPFIPVSEIMGVPESIRVDSPTPLTDVMVRPLDWATNTTIVWTIHNAGDTNATITSGNVLTATSMGTLILRATIANGSGQGIPFVYDFEIEVVSIIPVTEIRGVPIFLPIGTYNFHRYAVAPWNASERDVLWEIATGTTATGAVMNGSTLTTTGPGNVVVRATVLNGLEDGVDFVEYHTIVIDPDPTVSVPLTTGGLITNLVVHAFRDNVPATTTPDWAYVTGAPQIGDRLYGDRADVFAISQLHGLDHIQSWLRTRMDQREQQVQTQAMLTVTTDVYIYVAFEARVDRTRIFWIDDSWEHMYDDVYMRNSEASNDFPRYYFYRRLFTEGEVFRFGALKQGTGLGQAVVFFVDAATIEREEVTINNLPVSNVLPEGQTLSGLRRVGAFVNLNAGTRDGYEFSHWSFAPQTVDFEDVDSPTTRFFMPGYEVTVTAHWTNGAASGCDYEDCECEDCDGVDCECEDYEPTPTPTPTPRPEETPSPQPTPTPTPTQDDDDQGEDEDGDGNRDRRRPFTVADAIRDGLSTELDHQTRIFIPGAQVATWGLNRNDEISIETTFVDDDILNMLEDFLGMWLSNFLQIVVNVNGEPREDIDVLATVILDFNLLSDDDIEWFESLGLSIEEAIALLQPMLIYFEELDEYPYFRIGHTLLDVIIDGYVLQFTMTRTGIVGFVDAWDDVPFILPQVTRPPVQLVLTIGSLLYQVNGNYRESDVAPFIDPDTDRTMLPLRLVSEALGANVTWVESTRTVLITNGEISLSLQVDTPLPFGMGNVLFVNDRVFVPALYVMEFFGANVEWDSDTQTAYITQGFN